MHWSYCSLALSHWYVKLMQCVSYEQDRYTAFSLPRKWHIEADSLLTTLYILKCVKEKQKGTCISYHFSIFKWCRMLKYSIIEHKCLLIWYHQYRGCWWPGGGTSQGSGSHGIDLIAWIILLDDATTLLTKKCWQDYFHKSEWHIRKSCCCLQGHYAAFICLFEYRLFVCLFKYIFNPQQIYLKHI